MGKTAFVVGLAGGLLGVAVAFATLVWATSDGAPAGPTALSGAAALAAAVLGLACVGWLYRGGSRPVAVIGLIVAAVWHGVSISLFGIPGGLLLLISAILALMSIEEQGSTAPRR